MARSRYRPLFYAGLGALLLLLLIILSLGPLLAALGRFLVVDDSPEPSEAVVVLSTGIDYYPRLIEAAALFREGYAEKVVINGDRKSEALRALERRGFVPCCPWYENSFRILSLLGVPKEKIIAISAEEAYDTVSEAESVGKALLEHGISRIIVTTSKFHTRRARYIWHKTFPGRFHIRTVPARDDPYAADAWWSEGRQVRWVLAEYGAWIYYFWKTSLGIG